MTEVSVIIPCWNAERFVARAIQSALDQDCESTEVIVIDDGSTDGSLEVLKSFGDQITWRTGVNAGACAARNAGLALAHGKYVLFLDADDYLEGPYIEGLVSAASEVDVEMVLGPGVEERAGIRTNNDVSPFTNGWHTVLRAVVTGSTLQTAQMFFQRDFLSAIGGWDDRVTVAQDVELAVRAMLARPRLAIASEGNCVWHHHEGTRISSLNGLRMVTSHFGWYERTLLRTAQLGDPILMKQVAENYYHLAYLAFTFADDRIGRLALSRARQLGKQGHSGSLLRRLPRHILGLRAERILVRVMKRLRQKPNLRGLGIA